MKKWKPINKKTKVEYPLLTDEQKKEWESDPNIGPKYFFMEVKGSTPAPPPKEAKALKKK